MKEQRRSKTRTSYSAHVLITSSTGKTMKGLIRDIAIDSIYVHIEPVFAISEPVNIEIILLGMGSQLSIKMIARVERKDDTGVALLFRDPLEWWPIFTYFSSHNLNVSIAQDALSIAAPNLRKSASAFHGTLSVVTIENLMQLVSHAALSGELQLATSGNAAAFFVHSGTLVDGYLKKNSHRIGQRLTEGKHITTEQLQECLSLYKSEPTRPKIGSILVKKGYLQQDILEKIITEQIKDIFFEVLSWKEGSFTFSIENIPKDEDFFIEERIDHLILEGIINLENIQ
jgi:hypothetical protein